MGKVAIGKYIYIYICVYIYYLQKRKRKRKKDIKDIEKESKLIVAADKTTNFYKIKNEDYDELLAKNITKDYKKATRVSFKNVVKTD